MAITERQQYEAQKDWKRDRFEKRHAQLLAERSSWDSHYRELSDNILPRRGRFLGQMASGSRAGSSSSITTARVSTANRGDKRNAKIINNTGTVASRTLRDGMASGLINDARPWLGLSAEDDDRNEFAPVKAYLQKVERLFYAIFARSGFYGQNSQLLEEIGIFGTGAIAQLEDYNNVCRWQAFTAGEFCVANGPDGLVDTFYRDVSQTVEQVVGSYVFGRDWSGSGDWNKVSSTVKTLWDNGNYDAWVPVKHAVQCWHGSKRATQGRKWVGVYWEPGSDNPETFLEFKGFDEFPVHCPRWHTLSGDAYGRSPGMDALGDIKQLQLTERRKAQQLDFATAQPKGFPSSSNKMMPPLTPGMMVPIDPNMAAKVQSLYEQQIHYSEITADIQAIEHRIDDAFYVPLFLMLANMDSRQPVTAREVEERHEEKLLMLGPVLTQLTFEYLSPMIDRTYAMCERAGILPTAPKELQGQELKVEYISILAQAQKRVALGPLDAYLTAAVNMSSIAPAARFKIDAMQWMDEYGTKLGVPQTVVVDDDTAQQKADAEAKQAQQAQMMAAAPGLAGGVKDLAQSGVLPGATQPGAPLPPQ